MLSRFASAHQNPDDLEWQIVILEKQRPNVADIVGCRSCQRRKSLSGRFKMADYIKNLDEQGERDGDSAGRGQPVNVASFFGAKIEKHDDKKKEHHHGAGINQDLNDADEVSIERH